MNETSLGMKRKKFDVPCSIYLSIYVLMRSTWCSFNYQYRSVAQAVNVVDIRKQKREYQLSTIQAKVLLPNDDKPTSRGFF